MTTFQSNRKIVGILGGMGPYATCQFYQTILTLTKAAKDWDHCRIIIDSNPHIPSRSRHLIYGEESPLEGMFESCLKLENYPVDLITIPCNSASIFIPELRKRLKTPLLHIAEVTVNALKSKLPEAKRIGVLGGRVIYQNEMYRRLLSPAHEVIPHSMEFQTEIEGIIEALKLAKGWTEPMARLKATTRLMAQTYKIDAFIFACTEFHLISDITIDQPFIDSSYELAREVIRLATPQGK